MNKLRIISILFFCLFLFSCGVKKEKIVCYGDAHSNLAQLLTDEGYQLHFCTSVTEALRIASEQAPGFIALSFLSRTGYSGDKRGFSLDSIEVFACFHGLSSADR